MTNQTRTSRFLNIQTTASTYVGEVGSIFFDPTTTTLRIGDGVTAGGNIIDAAGPTGPTGPAGSAGSAGATGATGPTGATGSGALPIITVSYSGQSLSANNAIGGIGGSGISDFAGGAADVLYSVTSGTTVTATGAAFLWDGAPVTAVGSAGTGANGVRALVSSTNVPFVAFVYATNSSGTSYAVPAAGSSRTLCLAEGTLIAMSDGGYKAIENIVYGDSLLVWDFDRGRFTASEPLWIMQATSVDSYNALTFDDGVTLNTVGQHRIFNQQAGAFTYPLTDHTPLGTTSFNQYGREITLLDNRVVQAPMNAYNIITDYHLNLFANGVLTSNSFNNLYPIANMKFVKDGARRDFDDYQGVPDRFYYGMRLWEQPMEPEHVKQYIERMMVTESVQAHQIGCDSSVWFNERIG